MTVEVKELLANVPVANQDGTPTLELVEIIQRLVNKAEDLEARVAALEP